MSDFEFVSIILSIVVGLGITRVLSGLAATIRHRATLEEEGLSALWAFVCSHAGRGHPRLCNRSLHKEPTDSREVSVGLPYHNFRLARHQHAGDLKNFGR